MRRADGEYRWLLCSGVPRFTPSGAFAGYIGSDIDITDLKRAQVEAVERQKLESLGVLTSGIAHDFNNLLGSVLADAELAELEVSAGSSPVEQIQRIKAVAVRAAEIVRELMIYSGQDQADLGSVDLSRLVEEMLELLKVSISKHAVLKTDLRQSLPAVHGNAAQIRQVVMNLIINASEALGEKDGVIHVTTSLAGGGRNLLLPLRRKLARGRLPSPGGLRYRLRHHGGATSQDLRSVLLHQVRGTRAGPGGGARDCSRPRRRASI